MFTTFGCAAAACLLLPMLAVCLIVMLVLRLNIAYQTHKVKQRARHRQAQLDALLKEEHEWWLKLNDTETQPTKSELEHYASECVRVRHQIKKIARGEIPVLDYREFPLLHDNRYSFKYITSVTDEHPKLVLVENG